MAKGKKSKKDALSFKALITLEDLDQARKVAREVSVTRNVVLGILTLSGHRLAQFAWTEGDAFIDLLQCAMDFQQHVARELEVVQCAVARMIAVGNELSDNGKPAYVVGDQQPLQET